MGIEMLRAIDAAHGTVALVTIVETRGSAPRRAGSAMLVGPEGLAVGSVGGGKGESIAVEAARACLREGRSELLTVEMMGAEAEGAAPVCGGTNRMLVERVQDAEPYRRALRLLEAGLRALVVRRLEDHGGGRLRRVDVAVFDEKGERACGPDFPFDPEAAARCMRAGSPVYAEEKGLFYDPLFPEERMLVLGAGHVGLAVAALASTLDFRVTVVDDREEMLAPGRFPPNVETVHGGYREAIDGFPFDASTYAVIVTHGHLHDLECMRALLSKSCRYVGCIGSMRKTRLLLEQAKNDGFDAEKVEGLYAPIGLDIGAETPAEIAVSILGECIAVRRKSAALAGMSMARRAKRAASSDAVGGGGAP